MSNQVDCYLNDSRRTKRLSTCATHKSGKANGKPRGAGNDAQKENVARETGRRRGLPKVMELEGWFPCYNAVHKMGAEAGDPVVLVNPSEVVEAMKDIPQGNLITILEICKNIAKTHGAKACCSLTTGILS
jgi:hypothetical protein